MVFPSAFPFGGFRIIRVPVVFHWIIEAEDYLDFDDLLEQCDLEHSY
jgi:hypothetical protein